MNLLILCLALASVVLLVLAGVFLSRRIRAGKARPEAASGRQPSPADYPPAPYEMTAIDQLLYDRCCRYMTEHRPFLVESFSLQDLANAVYTNKSYLSKTINRFSGRNFRRYVNYYRIMYAMDLFRSNMSLRVTELAELSGFHSETSFFQSFKTIMGEAPSHWCARIRRKTLKK